MLFLGVYLGHSSVGGQPLVHCGWITSNLQRPQQARKEFKMNILKTALLYTTAIALGLLISSAKAEEESAAVKEAANRAAATQALDEHDNRAYDLESARARGRTWSQFSAETGGRALGTGAGVDGLLVSTIAAPFNWTSSGLDQLADAVAPEADKARAKSRALEIKRLEEKYQVDIDGDGKIADVVAPEATEATEADEATEATEAKETK